LAPNIFLRGLSRKTRCGQGYPSDGRSQLTRLTLLASARFTFRDVAHQSELLAPALADSIPLRELDGQLNASLRRTVLFTGHRLAAQSFAPIGERRAFISADNELQDEGLRNSWRV